MKHWLILAATAAAMTSFAPSASQAQVTVDTPVGGVHIGDRPHYRDYDGPVVRERRIYREREVGMRDCRTITIRRDDGSMKRIRRCD